MTKRRVFRALSVGAFLLFAGSAFGDSFFWAINQFHTIQKLNGDTGAVVDSFAVPFVGLGFDLRDASIAVIGNVGYYTQLQDSRVYKVDMTTHAYLGVAFDTLNGTLQNGITVDANNNLWFAHGAGEKLQQFNAAGTLLGTFSFPDAAFSFRDGSVVSGNFLVANRGDQVGPYDKYMINANGTLTYINKPFISGAGAFSGNNGIAFNGVNYYVSNEQQHIVYKFDINGNLVSQANLDPNSRYENWTFASQDIIPPDVPEPGSLILLGTGVLGGIGVLRRKLLN